MSNKNTTEMLDEDDDEEYEVYDEGATPPKELPSFQSMTVSTLEALSKYKVRKNPEIVTKFIAGIKDYFEDFGNGIEHEDRYQFSLRSKKGHSYIEFNFESGIIEIISGGYSQSEYGGDSYTNWMYNVGLNGWSDNNHYELCFSDIVDFVVNNETILSIYDPYEFYDREEDDE